MAHLTQFAGDWMSSAIEKQKYVLKTQFYSVTILSLLTFLGWLISAYLVKAPNVVAILLTAGLTLIIEIKLVLHYSETVRQRLLGLPDFEKEPMIIKFSEGTNRRITYSTIGVIAFFILQAVLLPHIESREIRNSIMAILPIYLLMYHPILQVIQYRELSSTSTDIGPTPLKFLSIFAPTSILSMLCSAFLCAGVIASIILANPLYLVPGTVCAVFLFIFARKSAKRLVSKYAVELPN